MKDAAAITPKQSAPTFKIEGVAMATRTLGTLSAGCRVIGITKGQFSLLDLIKSVLAQTGPADVLISTWTTGIRDTENANFMIENGTMRSFRLLTDRSFVTRQPKYVARVLEVFGEDSIRVTKTHAKFAIIRNEAWDIAIRSSMNLNRNPRWEQFDLDDSEDICDFFESLYDEIEESTPAGLVVKSSRVDAIFTSAFEDETPDMVEKVATSNSPKDVLARMKLAATHRPQPTKDAARECLERMAAARLDIEDIKRRSSK